MNILKQNTFWRRTISMKNYNELSDEQLAWLIKKENSSEAFVVLENKYIGTIYSIIRRHFKACAIGHAYLLDAECHAKIALYNAARNYDSKKGTKFSSYAYNCINGEIKNYINKNKSSVLELAMQRRLNMVKKVVTKSKELGLFQKDKEISDIIRDHREQLINLLSSKYPKENWGKFIDETSTISILSEISMDETKGESNKTIHDMVSNDIKKKHILSPQQLLENKLKNKGADGILLLKEKRDLFKRIYFHWMNKMVLLFCENSRSRSLVYYCLKNYYINFEDESIINRIDSMGYSGYDYLRKIRSRFEKSISQENTGFLYMMINELNKHFYSEFEYLTKKGSLRTNFRNFCKSVRNWILPGEES